MLKGPVLAVTSRRLWPLYPFPNLIILGIRNSVCKFSLQNADVLSNVSVKSGISAGKILLCALFSLGKPY